MVNRREARRMAPSNGGRDSAASDKGAIFAAIGFVYINWFMYKEECYKLSTKFQLLQ